MKARASQIVFVVAAVIVLAGGCALWKKNSLQVGRNPNFPHKIHTADAGLDCEMCHAGAKTGARAEMPALETCKNCHSEEADVQKKIAPFAPQGTPLWTQFTALSDEIKFSHKNHLDKGQKCQDCHGDVGQSNQINRRAVRLDMDRCMNCHEQKKAPNDCATCHAKISQDTQPSSHDLNWKRYHGQVARAQLKDPIENRCSLCHNEDTCAACHRAEEPQSHTNQFRLRGHGIQARIDRSTCATCHQSDFCDRCHAETTPMTHRAGFGEPRNTHCYSCHFPVADQSCATCHKQMPGHLEAPGVPGGVTHETASEYGCRSCHETNLTHPDNGDSCRNCHR